MPVALILGLIGGLLILAFLANRVFRLTRVPDVVVLMGLGVLLGPGLGLLNAEVLGRATNLLGTLAIILVLFEGGLELDLRRTLRHFPGSLLLAILAYVFTMFLVALIVSKGLGLPWMAGLLAGAVVGCTSSTVVLPVMHQVEADEPVKVTLMLEASWGDVLAVLTVGLLLGLQHQDGPIALSLAHGVLTQVGVALLFAVATGVLWSRLLPVLSEQHFWQVLTLSIVLVLYAGMEALGANGLIAVLAFGLTLSNFPGVDPELRVLSTSTAGTHMQRMLLSFHSELAFLVRTFFFVLIGAVAELGAFRRHPWLMLSTIAALFLGRWLAIQASRWAWTGIDARGREIMLWILPRGLVTVVLSIAVASERGAELSFLPGLAFAVIMATNLSVILGSWRARRSDPAVEPAVSLPEHAPEPAAAAGLALTVSTGPVSTEPQRAAPPAPTPRRNRRWILDSALLFLLALSALFLWYGNQSPESRPASMERWVRRHWGRGN